MNIQVDPPMGRIQSINVKCVECEEVLVLPAETVSAGLASRGQIDVTLKITGTKEFQDHLTRHLGTLDV